MCVGVSWVCLAGLLVGTDQIERLGRNVQNMRKRFCMWLVRLGFFAVQSGPVVRTKLTIFM